MSDISLPGRPLIEKIDKICGICLWEKANLKPLCDVALIEVCIFHDDNIIYNLLFSGGS